MNLNDEQRRALRGKAHKLKPVVLLGKAGLTDPVLVEVNTALDFHELIKVKVRDDDREQRRETIDSLVARSGAELIQVIGQIAVLYRPSPEKKTPAKPARREKGRDAAGTASRRGSEKSRRDARSSSHRSDEPRKAFPKSSSRRAGADRRPPKPGRRGS